MTDTGAGTPDRVLIAGASGDTGHELLSVLRPTDLTVRATTRSYANVETLERLGADEVIVADFFESADAVAAVEDCDILYCALGTPPSWRHTVGGKLVDRTGVINLVTAAMGADVSFVVLESAIGVGNSKAGLSLPARLLIRGSLRAKRDAEVALCRSGLAYTIIRPGRLTNAPPTDEPVVGEGGNSVAGSIPRADVARLMAVAPFTPEARNRTFEVVSRDGLSERPRNVVRIDWAFDRLADLETAKRDKR
ncbi:MULTISPECIES: NAD(P)H-binding protein [Natronorubrum]|uniref:3-beta hydroxysteroid dehydrogenase/isomerase family protein n=2 Tax=Natronorubrum bangense TaxID=61858 RepID=L9WCC6_9EURY|nr:NAD(P)H-binding protein [Natronorubrum bangense]ELY47145.1 3-beta hydroxysteroid dehydrogenase/isomerase family protein [Natronorubrum bangense JCM 10635]QCC53418.1 3-beta hydroxysteroid dehydrogenase [Natronorubrum bangense]